MLIPEGLDARIRKAAQRSRLSKGAWVRGAIERAIAEDRQPADPLAKLASLGAPTGDIDQTAGRDRGGAGLMIFIDSNIPMYVAGRDHPLRAPAMRFLERVRAGEVEACSSTEVLQEILYRYAGLKRLDLAREVYNLFVNLCPVILPVTLADTDRARDLLSEARGISVRDAVHAAVMLNNGVSEVATFDAGFDLVPGVERLRLS